MRHNTNTLTGLLPILIVFLFFSAFPNDAFSKGGKNKIRKSEKMVEAGKKGEGKEKVEVENIDAGKKTKDSVIIAEEKSEARDEFSYTGMIVQTIVILVLFVGGFYYFFRFVTKKAGIQVLGGETIKVLSIVPLGQNKFIQVVDLAGKILVLGVADSSINLITEITSKNEIDRIRLLSSKSRPLGKKSFKDYIAKHMENIMGRFSSRDKFDEDDPGAVNNDTQFDLNYLKKQKDRLKKLNGFDDE